MQLEMLQGGSPLFFDLFVALANHIDDVIAYVFFLTCVMSCCVSCEGFGLMSRVGLLHEVSRLIEQ